MDRYAELWRFLLTGGGALIGAWFGARLSVVRVRRERAFERQLEWHEQITDALNRVRLDLAHLVVLARNPAVQAERLTEQWLAAIDGIHGFVSVASKAEMYAARDTGRRLLALIHDLVNIGRGIGRAPDDDAEFRAHIERYVAAIPLVSEAASALASDVRRYLDIPSSHGTWYERARDRLLGRRWEPPPLVDPPCD